MRSITQATLGGPDVLEVAEVPRPEPFPTEVLVRVAAAGVNPVDWKVRTRGGFLGEPPFTVGWDVAGVVEALGGGVTRFAVGDRVFGMPRFPREAAAYAEYVTSPSRQLARTPDGMSDVEAGGLPLAGLTAWQALVETADVQPGQRVLILAAAGGVGHLAVQIAKARGAHVIGTASAGKHAFLREIGADETIDYTSEDVAARVGDRRRRPRPRGRRRRRAHGVGAARGRHLHSRAVGVRPRAAARAGGRSASVSPASSSSRIDRAWRRLPASSTPASCASTSHTRSRSSTPPARTSSARRAARRASSS